jgi:hypothetical protein
MQFSVWAIRDVLHSDAVGICTLYVGGYWMNVNGIQYGDETNQYINIWVSYIILYA